MSTANRLDTAIRLATAMRRAMTIIRHLEIEDDVLLSAMTAHSVLYEALAQEEMPVYEENDGN